MRSLIGTGAAAGMLLIVFGVVDSFGTGMTPPGLAERACGHAVTCLRKEVKKLRASAEGR